MNDSRRASKKLEWFSRGVEALQRARPGTPAVYCCPLCIRGFELEFLTFEDVPPKSVGGRPLVLTCAECNGHSGRHLEPHLRKGEDIREFAAGTRTIRVDLAMDESSITADMQKTPEGLLFLGVPKHSSNAHHAAFSTKLEELARTGSLDWGFTVRPRLRHDVRAEQLSWLRAAYLIAFAALGYTYIMRPELSGLRSQLEHPQERLLPFLMAQEPAAESRVRRMMFVFEPTELRSLFVQVGNRLAFLPDFPADNDFFENITASVLGKSGPLTVRGVPVAWPTKPEFTLDFTPDRLFRYFPPQAK